MNMDKARYYVQHTHSEFQRDDWHNLMLVVKDGAVRYYSLRYSGHIHLLIQHYSIVSIQLLLKNFHPVHFFQKREQQYSILNTADHIPTQHQYLLTL